MASIRPIGKKWRAEVRRKGVTKSANFKTKGEARAWAEVMERRILGGAKEYSKDLTFEFVCTKYLDEVARNKKGRRWEAVRINKFINSGLGDFTLEQLDAKFWRSWIKEQLQSLSPASVNRELNLIGAVLTMCATEWEFMEANPLKSVKRPKMPKHRERLVLESEREAITQYLGADPDTSSGQLAIAFNIALETGLRRGELFFLEWANVHTIDRYLTVVDSKNGDKRDVPLSSSAVEWLELMACGRNRVFTVSPDTASTLFRKACRKLGIEDLRFHDARHSAVVALSKKFTVIELARVIGHRDLKSLMIYYNESAQELAKRLD